MKKKENIITYHSLHANSGRQRDAIQFDRTLPHLTRSSPPINQTPDPEIPMRFNITHLFPFSSCPKGASPVPNRNCSIAPFPPQPRRFLSLSVFLFPCFRFHHPPYLSSSFTTSSVNAQPHVLLAFKIN